MIAGDDLRRMRLMARLSSRKVADKVGVTRKTIENWEADIGQPKLNQFISLCSLYHFNAAKVVAKLMLRKSVKTPLELEELREQEESTNN